MIDDFNIRDSDWDSNFYHYSIHTEDLLTIADSLGLELSPPSNPGPIRFADNPHDSNLVLNLVFLVPNNPGFGQYTLLLDSCKPSNHIPLVIYVDINNENIDSTIQSIKKDSEEESNFINEIRLNVKLLDTQVITNRHTTTDQLSLIYEKAWNKHFKPRHITRHSKEWWNQECTDNLNFYRLQDDIAAWKTFKSNIREAKQKFFDEKILKIATSNKRPWDLMNWVKKRTLPAIETITYEKRPCNMLLSLWNALYCSYNSATNQLVNLTIFNNLPKCNNIDWPPFSEQEVRNTIVKCSSSSTPGLDHISWRHLKPIVANNECLGKIVTIANTCIKYET